MTKYNPETVGQIVQLIEQGAFAVDACMAVGISTDTFYEWLKKSDFSDAIKKARAKAINVRVLRISKAGQNGNWQADAWWLERVARARFGREAPVQQQETKITIGFKPDSPFIKPIDVHPAPQLNAAQRQSREVGIIKGKQAVARGEKPRKKGSIPRKK